MCVYLFGNLVLDLWKTHLEKKTSLNDQPLSQLACLAQRSASNFGRLELRCNQYLPFFPGNTEIFTQNTFEVVNDLAACV